MIVRVQFANEMKLSTISYCRKMTVRWFIDWWLEKWFHVIVSLSSLSVLVTMPLVGYADELKISRWSFECNFQIKCIYLQYHIAGNWLRDDLEMDYGRNDPNWSFHYHLSPFLRRCLSLAMLMNWKLADDRSSAICKWNEAIYNIILQEVDCEMIQRLIMVNILPIYRFIIISLRSWVDAFRWIWWWIEN